MYLEMESELLYVSPKPVRNRQQVRATEILQLRGRPQRLFLGLFTTVIVCSLFAAITSYHGKTNSGKTVTRGSR